MLVSAELGRANCGGLFHHVNILEECSRSSVEYMLVAQSGSGSLWPEHILSTWTLWHSFFKRAWDKVCRP